MTHAMDFFRSYFAAGCSTSSKRKIVAPSFVTVTSPISSTNILSNPTGPSELLTMLAIEEAAITGWWKQKQNEELTPTFASF